MFRVDLPSSLRIAVGGALLVALIGFGAVMLPQAVTNVDLLRADDDPSRLTQLRLPAVATKQRIAAEIDEALNKGDADLARSFLDLADTQGVKIGVDQRSRVAALMSAPGAAAGSNFLDGVASGTADTWSGTAGSLAADLVGISDVRDLWQEGRRLVQGEPHDRFILGLSAPGLARMISGMGEDIVALEACVGQRGAAQALGFARDAGRLCGNVEIGMV